MADSKDDAPHGASDSIADVFSSVARWQQGTLGESLDSEFKPRRAEGNPFARADQDLLPGWSLPGQELLAPPISNLAPEKPASEPLPSKQLNQYFVHEESYDPECTMQDFFDPLGFALAVRGAPQLEPLRHNTGSISGGSPNQKAPPQNASLGAAPMATSSSLTSSDALSSGAASLHGAGTGIGIGSDVRSDEKLASVWRKLWRY